MSKLLNKYVVILVLVVFCFSSCRTKKTFNGTAELPCPDHSNSVNSKKDEGKTTKWKLVLYKDGKRVGGKVKRGKSKLFDQ